MVKRILIVEDEPDVQEIERMVVEDLLGCHATLASTGEEALSKAREIQPDLVLLDLLLPGMDGFAVAAEIRSDSQFSHTCILALSGLSRPEDRDRARAAGCDDTLAKPFDLDDLVRKIEGLVGSCSRELD